MEKSTKKTTPAKTKKHYWGITSYEPNGSKVIFEGSFKECWLYLVKTFGHYKLSYITTELGIKIDRIG